MASTMKFDVADIWHPFTDLKQFLSLPYSFDFGVKPQNHAYTYYRVLQEQ